jgi:hypothetical protein
MLEVQLSLPRAKSARRLTWNFLAQLVPGPAAHAGQKMISSEDLTAAGDHLAHTAEGS